MHVRPLTITNSNGFIRYESTSPSTIPTLNVPSKELSPISPDEIQNDSGTEWYVVSSRGKHNLSQQPNMTIPIPIRSSDNTAPPRSFKSMNSPVGSTEVTKQEEITNYNNPSTDKYVTARNEQCTVRQARTTSLAPHLVTNPRELPDGINAFTKLIKHPNLIKKIYDKMPSSKYAQKLKIRDLHLLLVFL